MKSPVGLVVHRLTLPIVFCLFLGIPFIFSVRRLQDGSQFSAQSSYRTLDVIIAHSIEPLETLVRTAISLQDSAACGSVVSCRFFVYTKSSGGAFESQIQKDVAVQNLTTIRLDNYGKESHVSSFSFNVNLQYVVIATCAGETHCNTTIVWRITM